MKKVGFGGIVIVLLAASVGSGEDKVPPPQRPQLSAEYAKRRDQVLPTLREQSYRKIDWRTSVLRGIIAAQKKDSPIMIVLMNGHPLGCT